jgi:predicted nucleic acid-binding protein
MSDWAVDSSVATKWFLPEPDSAIAQRVVAEVAAQGHRLIILDLALIEVSNAIWVRFHRKQYPSSQADTFFNDLMQADVDVRPSQPLLRSAFALATRYGLAVYDALFVALTADLGIPGVTSDEPLYRAVHADHPQIHLLRHWPPPAPPAVTPP